MYWESEPYEVIYNTGPAITINVKLKSRISRANFSRTINGKAYYNLIEVTSDLYPKDSSGEYPSAISTTSTIFSKGIGIVYYEDLSNPPVNYGLNSYDVIP